MIAIGEAITIIIGDVQSERGGLNGGKSHQLIPRLEGEGEGLIQLWLSVTDGDYVHTRQT